MRKRRSELRTNWGLSYLSTFCNRRERERFTKIIEEWKGDKDKTKIIREMLFEHLTHCHILQQRLYDQSLDFAGNKTDYHTTRKLIDEDTGWQSSEKVGVLSSNDQDMKQKEMEKYLPMLSKIQIDLARLLMAKDVMAISVQDDRSVNDLFSALEKRGAVVQDNGKEERI